MSETTTTEQCNKSADATRALISGPLHIHNIAELEQPSFDALAAAWLTHHESSDGAAENAFDIVVLGQLLNEGVLLDVHSTKSAIFRFVGPAVCRRLQGDPTGLDLMQLIEQFPFEVSGIIHEMLSTPTGLHAVYEMSYMSGRKSVNRGFYLPLMGTRGRPAQIIGMQAAGSTVAFDTQPLKTVVATKLQSLTWVDLGAGVSKLPLQFEAG